MQTLTAGQKLNLSDLTPSSHLRVRVQVTHPDIDLAVFGLDAERQLKDDRYFIFFNQTSSPEGAISPSGETQDRSFELSLDRLPTSRG